EAHPRGRHNSDIGHNVLKGALIHKRDTRKGRPGFEAAAEPFCPSDPEFHRELLDLMVIAFRKPSALLGRVGECREYTLGRLEKAALDDERVVNDRSISHGLDPPKKVKS